MTEQLHVKNLYTRLAVLLGVGLLAGLIAWMTVKPGSGSISVGGATAGVGIATVTYIVVLAASLYFMNRVALVIASLGGTLATHRYKTLLWILAIGVAAAVVIGLFAKPDLSSADIGALLIGCAVVLATITIVMVAFLGFMRRVVSHSGLPDAPNISSLYLTLSIIGVLGLIAGAIVLAVASPGSGPIHVAGTLFGVGFAVLVAALVTLGLLIYLSSTVKDAIQVVENPASGPAVRPGQDRGAHSDPNVSYSPLRAATEREKVIEVEGIGPTYAQRLEQKMGIKNFGQLFEADEREVASQIDTTSEQVRQWQQMIHLMDVKGIGPQYSEMLVMAGITTPKELSKADPEALLERIDEIEARRKKSRVLKVNVELAMVERFVEMAKQHRAAQD